LINNENDLEKKIARSIDSLKECFNNNAGRVNERHRTVVKEKLSIRVIGRTNGLGSQKRI